MNSARAGGDVPPPLLRSSLLRNNLLASAAIYLLLEIWRPCFFLTDDNLVSSHDLLNLCRKLGFSLHTIPDESLVRVTLRL